MEHARALCRDGDATAALSALSARGYTPIDVIESSDGSTALHLVAGVRRHDDGDLLARFLRAICLSTPSIDAVRDDNGSTPLHRAAFFGNRRAAQQLVSAGAGPDTPNAEGRTPLHLAADAGDEDCLRIFVEELLGSRDVASCRRLVDALEARDTSVGHSPLTASRGRARRFLESARAQWSLCLNTNEL